MLENFLVLAEANTASTGGAFGQMLIPFLLIGAMMFFMFRSQKKEAKRRQEMLDGIRTGDKILTMGGIHGVVKTVNEDTYIVEIAEKVKVEVSKTGVNNITKKESK